MPEEIAAKRDELVEAIEAAEARRALAAEALAVAEAALCAKRRWQSARRSGWRARRAKARRGPKRGWMRRARRWRLAAERIAEEDDRTPQELLASLKVDPDKMPDAEALDNDVQRLKRQREALGAVNLRAEEDAKTVDAEYTALATEKDGS